MLERCSTARLAEIAQPNAADPCKEIGTPSLKAVGELSTQKKNECLISSNDVGTMLDFSFLEEIKHSKKN